jgi:hypothetical protein
VVTLLQDRCLLSAPYFLGLCAIRNGAFHLL